MTMFVALQRVHSDHTLTQCTTPSGRQLDEDGLAGFKEISYADDHLAIPNQTLISHFKSYQPGTISCSFFAWGKWSEGSVSCWSCAWFLPTWVRVTGWVALVRPFSYDSTSSWITTTCLVLSGTFCAFAAGQDKYNLNRILLTNKSQQIVVLMPPMCQTNLLIGLII